MANTFDNITCLIREKFSLFSNKNNTPQLKIDIFKGIYALFLSDEGKEFLTQRDRLRNVFEQKIIEFMEYVVAQNDLQFMSQSYAALTVIANINLGKNLEEMYEK